MFFYADAAFIYLKIVPSFINILSTSLPTEARQLPSTSHVNHTTSTTKLQSPQT